MSWLREKLLENTLWVGEQGAWAQFRTAQLPSRREMRAAYRGDPQRPWRAGLAAKLPGAGGAGVPGLVLEAKLVHLRGLENPHPREEKEDGISPGVGTGPRQPETMAPGASTTPPLLRRELNTLEIGV